VGWREHVPFKGGSTALAGECAGRTWRERHREGLRACWPRASDRSRVKQRVHPTTARFTSLIQASQEKWKDKHEFANRIPDANCALSSVLQEAELESILLKGVGRECRALGRNFNTQGRTFPKLRKFLAKTGAATQEARGVKLQAKPKGSTSRSVGGEEREPRRTRPAASVALPVGAASAAAALSVTDYGTEAERSE